MVREGIADFAITEDSDLIGFGCPRILMKMDPKTGRGLLYDQ
jgi:5'-3' exonuclease